MDLALTPAAFSSTFTRPYRSPFLLRPEQWLPQCPAISIKDFISSSVSFSAHSYLPSPYTHPAPEAVKRRFLAYLHLARQYHGALLPTRRIDVCRRQCRNRAFNCLGSAVYGQVPYFTYFWISSSAASMISGVHVPGPLLPLLPPKSYFFCTQ